MSSPPPAGGGNWSSQSQRYYDHGYNFALHFALHSPTHPPPPSPPHPAPPDTARSWLGVKKKRRWWARCHTQSCTMLTPV